MTGTIPPQIEARNALVSQCWTPPSTPPKATSMGPHYPVTILATIEDPYFSEEPFVDIVSYWPALKKYTCTHQVRTDTEADDYNVTISGWQPIFPAYTPATTKGQA